MCERGGLSDKLCVCFCFLKIFVALDPVQFWIFFFQSQSYFLKLHFPLSICFLGKSGGYLTGGWFRLPIETLICSSDMF